ncbi:MAG: hypothetical protein R3C15_04405 [Thermoleophilia bacterium]
MALGRLVRRAVRQLADGDDVGAPRTSVRPPSRAALQRRRDANGTSASTGSAAAGNASPIAASVAFRADALAARRPSASARAAASTPGAGIVPTTPGAASVSVPVLSMQTTSAEASDSIAFSCCASAPRRAIRSAATAKVRLVSRISPRGRG